MISYLDQPPAGWFILDVMQRHTDENPRRQPREWSALMVDVDPDELKNCICDMLVRLYVHPKDYRPGSRKASHCWVRIPGKHKSRTAAWGVLEEMMATRH
jgi:hypothetical protein